MSVSDPDSVDHIVADAGRAAERRDQGCRERALKLYPWICGRCVREFTRTNVCELTVRQRDRDHDNNPPDGSNRELLCLHCYDNEHQRLVEATGASIASLDLSAELTTRTLNERLAMIQSIVATIKTKAGNEAEFQAAALKLVAAVRANEPGCLMYTLNKGDASDSFVFMERYADEEAVKAHRGSEHFKTLGRAMAAFMDGPPDVLRMVELG